MTKGRLLMLLVAVVALAAIFGMMIPDPIRTY